MHFWSSFFGNIILTPGSLFNQQLRPSGLKVLPIKCTGPFPIPLPENVKSPFFHLGAFFGRNAKKLSNFNPETNFHSFLNWFTFVFVNIAVHTFSIGVAWAQALPTKPTIFGSKVWHPKWSAPSKNLPWKWPVSGHSCLVLVRNGQKKLFWPCVFPCPV